MFQNPKSSSILKLIDGPKLSPGNFFLKESKVHGTRTGKGNPSSRTTNQRERKREFYADSP